MSEREPASEPVDLATIADDDLLLDSVGRAEAVSGDALTEMLSAWRADLDADLPDGAGFRLVGALLEEEGGRGRGLEERRGGHRPEQAPLPLVPRRARRLRRLALGVAAAAVALAGVSVAADHARPGSPLWPVTEVLYPQQAEVRAAERAIAQARTAVAEHRFDEARRRLDEAETHVARVRDSSVATRLRAEIDEIRRILLPLLPPGSAPSAGPSAVPSAGPSAAPSSGRSPAPAPQPGGNSTGSGSTPGLPKLPVESPLEPLPLPSLPLPSLPLSPLPLSPLPLLPSGGLL